MKFLQSKAVRIIAVIAITLSSTQALFVLGVPKAFAATITVDTTSGDDDGQCGSGAGTIYNVDAGNNPDCTVLEAVKLANFNSGTDTISILTPGTYTADGTPSITQGEPVSVVGAGSGSVTLTSGGGTIFNVESGAASGFSLQGVTIDSGGQAAIALDGTDGADGGTAPDDFVGDFTINNVVVAGDPTIGVWLGGTSATDNFNINGNVSITNCTFNVASAGILAGMAGGSPTVPLLISNAHTLTISDNAIYLTTTGPGGANTAVALYSAASDGAATVDGNTIIITGTDPAAGVMAADIGGVGAAFGSTVNFSSNSVSTSGGTELGGGIVQATPSTGMTTVSSNNVSGTIPVGANPGSGIMAVNFACFMGPCTDLADATVANNNVNIISASGANVVRVGAYAETVVMNGNTVDANNDTDQVANLVCGAFGATGDCTIYNNIIKETAAQAGIAVKPLAANQSMVTTIYNNLVYGAADDNSFGIVIGNLPDSGISSATNTTINATVMNNTIDGSTHATGVMYADLTGDSDVFAKAFNNIIVSYGANAGMSAVDGGGTITVTSDYNLIGSDGTGMYSGISTGAHDIFGDPDFTNSGTGDYSLLNTSPAKDVGVMTFSSANTSDLDILGNTRPIGAAADFGAYEIQNTAPTANAGSDQYTSIDESNTLDCSGSTDPEDDTLSYWWSQTSGTPAWVTLSSNSAAAPTFTPTTFGDYNFQCQAIDPGTLNDTDTTVVHATAKRIAGASDRYDTAVKISQTQYPTTHTVNRLVIASGENYPDALAAGPLASLIGGPILLVQKNWLPSQTNTEITRLLPTSDGNGSTTDIYVIGGTAAISDYVYSTIRSAHPGFELKRIAGASDRIDTAIEIAKEMATIRGNAATTIALASGYNYNDAAAMSAPASDSSINSRRIPIFLTNTTNLDSRVSTYLNSIKGSVTKAWIIGTTGAVSNSAQTSMNSIFGSSKVSRLNGADAYGTSAAIATQFYGSPTQLSIVTGQNFPDVLAAGPYAGSKHMAVLYVTNTTVDATVNAYADAKASTLTSMYVFGGTSVVPNSIKQTVQAHL